MIGRFVTADTIVPGLFNPQSLNRYSYVLNSPLIYVDPTGHEVDNYFEDPDKENPEWAGYSKKEGTWGASSGGGWSGGAGANRGNNDGGLGVLTFTTIHERFFGLATFTETTIVYDHPFDPEKGWSRTLRGATAARFLRTWRKVGDYFTIGLSGGYILGAGFSFDRVVMPGMKPDWFFTFGGGITTPGVTLAIDRGKIWNENIPSNFDKLDILGPSVSSDLSLGLVGFEVVGANFLEDSTNNEMIGIKGGLRVGTGAGGNVFGNWTFDIGD